MNNILLLGVFLFVGNVYADTGSATWTDPIEREDGTPLDRSEISHYNVYQSNGVSGVYPTVQQVTGNNADIPLINGVKSHAVVTTVDTDGRESAYSTEVVLPAAASSPGAPSDITIIIKYGE